jgi:hypothetical protein
MPRDVQNSRDKGACVLRALSQWPACCPGGAYVEVAREAPPEDSPRRGR